MKTFSLFILNLVLICICIDAEFPARFKRCDRSENNFNQCLGEAIKDALKNLKGPLAAYGIPSLEPAKVPHLAFSGQSEDGPFDVAYAYYEIHKCTKIDKPPKVNMDFNKLVLQIDFIWPELVSTFEAYYNGSIKEQRVQGDGIGRLIWKNPTFNETIYLEKVQIAGKRHYRVKHVTSKFDVDDHIFKFYEFKGTRGRDANSITKLFNNNKEEVFLIYKHSYELMLGSDIRQWFDSFLSKVTIEDLFGDD